VFQRSESLQFELTQQRTIGSPGPTDGSEVEAVCNRAAMGQLAGQGSALAVNFSDGDGVAGRKWNGTTCAVGRWRDSCARGAIGWSERAALLSVPKA
jgi:hypothetical protein